MARRSSVSLLALAAIALIAMLAAGCSKSSSSNNNNNNPVAPDLSASDSLVRLANEQLGTIISGQVGTNPTRPADLDYRTPYATYQQALLKDSSNPNAHFGVAILELMSLTQDAQVNAAFDEWNAYLKNHTPFQVGTSAARPLGVPASLGRGNIALRLPVDLVPMSVLATTNLEGVAADPQISTVQGIFNSVVLPKLRDCTAHLATVAASPSFQFFITPKMQGDAYADSLRIHHTEVLALKAACELLTAACDIGVAYNLGFDTLDSLGLVHGLTQGSGGWMKLNSYGASDIGDARAQTLAATYDADSAATNLLGRVGVTSRDLIKLYPGQVTQVQLDSLRAGMQRLRNALNGGFVATGNFDGDTSTPDQALTVRLDRFFGNPVNDVKSLLPAYTVTTARRALRESYYSAYGIDSTQVTFPAAEYSYGTYLQVVVYHGAVEYADSTGSATMLAAMRVVMNKRLAALAQAPGWTGDYNIYLYPTANSWTAGHQAVLFNYDAYYIVGQSYVFVPVITWQATTAAAFRTAWPDPTMNGLLPQFTSSANLMDFVGYEPSDFQHVLVLDWTILGGYYWYGGFSAQHRGSGLAGDVPSAAGFRLGAGSRAATFRASPATVGRVPVSRR